MHVASHNCPEIALWPSIEGLNTFQTPPLSKRASMINHSLKNPRSKGQPLLVREAGFTARWTGFVNTGRLERSRCGGGRIRVRLNQLLRLPG
jgi:hypothetical protein